jgi:ethanolamine utilization protein EutQ (cupin superfamily)
VELLVIFVSSTVSPADLGHHTTSVGNREVEMKVQKFSLSDAKLERSPGQDADIFVGNLIDEKDGGPVRHALRS